MPKANGTPYATIIDTNLFFKTGQIKCFTAFARKGLIRNYIPSISLEEYKRNYDKVWRNKHEQKYKDANAPISVQNDRMKKDKKRDLEYILKNFTVLDISEEEADNYHVDWSGSDRTDRFLAACAEKYGIGLIATADNSSIPRERLEEKAGIKTFSQNRLLSIIMNRHPVPALKAIKSVSNRDDYTTGLRGLKELDDNIIKVHAKMKEAARAEQVRVQAHVRNGKVVESFTRKPRSYQS